MDWDILLPWMQIANNDTKCQSTGKTPFEMNNGRVRRTLLDVELEAAGVANNNTYPGAKELAEKIKKIHGEAIVISEKAQERQRKNAETGRRESSIKQGDKVWLSRKNLRVTGEENRVRKLDSLYYGPYEVEKMIGTNAARLKLPQRWKIHNEINLEYLKLYIDGTKSHPQRIIQNNRPGPSQVENDPASGGPSKLSQEDPEFEVEAIIGRKQRRQDIQYKVKWKGWPIEFASWQSVEDLTNCMELVEEFESQRVSAASILHQARTIQLSNIMEQAAAVRDFMKLHKHGKKNIGRKSTPKQREEREAAVEKEKEQERELAKKSVKSNVPLEEVKNHPPINKDGLIKMPTQVCIADSKNGHQCKHRTQHGAYCWIHLAQLEGARIKQSNIKDAGKGLFATRDFKKGEKIADYTGDLVLVKDGNDNEPSGNLSHYILELTQVIGIDAARTNTAAGRMVNDARRTEYNNNVRFSCNQINKTAKLIALRNIKKGEEFYVSYGKNYWPAHRKLKEPIESVKKIIKQESEKEVERDSGKEVGSKQKPICIDAIVTITAALNAIKLAMNWI
jgi:hypothetical protein